MCVIVILVTSIVYHSHNQVGKLTAGQVTGHTLPNSLILLLDPQGSLSLMSLYVGWYLVHAWSPSIYTCPAQPQPQ